jgi:hypothetical protein
VAEVIKISNSEICRWQFPNYLAVLGLSLLSVELIISIVAHGLWQRSIGYLYLLIHPFTLLVGYVMLAKRDVLRSVVGRARHFVLGILLLILPPMYHLIFGGGAENGAYVWFAGIGLLIGFTVGISKLRDQLIRYYLVGIVIWALLIIVLYVIGVVRVLQVAPWLNDVSLDHLIVAMRTPGQAYEELFHHGLVAGNWNKASNIALLASLLCLRGVINKTLNKPFAFTVLGVIATLQVIAFSRGAYLASVVCIVAVFCMRRTAFRAPTVRAAALVILLPFLLSLSVKDFRSQWVDFSSTEARLTQAKGIMREGQIIPSVAAASLERVSTALLGQGIGEYGRKHFNRPEAGTHNLFLDTWLASGAIGLVGLLLILSPIRHVARPAGWPNFTLDDWSRLRSP